MISVSLPVFLLADVDYSGRITSNNPSCRIRCGMVPDTRISLSRFAKLGLACRCCSSVDGVRRVVRGLNQGSRACGVSWRVSSSSKDERMVSFDLVLPSEIVRTSGKLEDL